MRKRCLLLTFMLTFLALSDAQAAPRLIYKDNTFSVEIRDVKKLKGIKPEKSFSHPYFITEDRLRNILNAIYYQEKGLLKKKDSRRVFGREEIEIVVPPIVEALSKAAPGEDVFVTYSSKRSLLSDLASTFSLFATDKYLNIAFSQVRSTEKGPGPSFKDWKKGSPEEPTSVSDSSFWELVPGEGQRLKENHKNWLVIEVDNPSFDKKSALVQEEEEPGPSGPLEERLKRIEAQVGLAPGSTPQEELASKEEPYRDKTLTQRLRELKGLLDEELISPEEYEYKKTEILKKDFPKDKTVTERFKELRNLKDEGLITEKDYEKKKKELLGKL